MVRNEDFDNLTTDDIQTDRLQEGENPAETISGTGSSLQFTGNDTRDIHDSTDVSLSNASGASVTEDVTVNYYQGVDNTGTLETSETQSVTLADAASTTVTYLTADFALDNVDYYIEVTTTDLTADSIDEHTLGAEYVTEKSSTGDLVTTDQNGRTREIYHSDSGKVEFTDTVEISSGILDITGNNGDVHSEGIRIFGGSFGYNEDGGEETSIYDIANDVHVLTATAGGDLQITTDLFEVPNSSTTTRIPGLYITQGKSLAYNEGGSQSFSIYNDTSGNHAIQAQSDDTVTFPTGDVELTNANSELRTNAIIILNGKAIGYNRGGAESTGFYNETSGSFGFQVDENNNVSVPNGSLSVSDNTEISESAAGSTTIQNTAGNPVNIQLSPSGRAFLVGNDTATTIDTQDTWYEISGTWDSAHLNHLSHSAGTLTYDGDVTTQTEYNVGGSYSSADNNANYEIAMFKDGSVKSNTIIDFSPPRAGETLSIPNIFGFTDATDPGTSHSVRVRCTSGTTDITIHALSFTMKG